MFIVLLIILLKILSSLDINGIAETKFMRYIVTQGFVHFPLKQKKQKYIRC